MEGSRKAIEADGRKSLPGVTTLMTAFDKNPVGFDIEQLSRELVLPDRAQQDTYGRCKSRTGSDILPHRRGQFESDHDDCGMAA